MDRPQFIYPFSSKWVVSTFSLWWIMLLWTFTYKFLYGHMFSFLVSIYLWVEFLGHVAILCFTVWGTTRLFAKVAVPFHTPARSIGGFWFLPILHILAACCYVFLIATILLGEKWYFTVVLISLCLLTSNSSAVFWGYRPVRLGWAPLLLLTAVWLQ